MALCQGSKANVVAHMYQKLVLKKFGANNINTSTMVPSITHRNTVRMLADGCPIAICTAFHSLGRFDSLFEQSEGAVGALVCSIRPVQWSSHWTTGLLGRYANAVNMDMLRPIQDDLVRHIDADAPILKAP